MHETRQNLSGAGGAGTGASLGIFAWFFAANRLALPELIGALFENAASAGFTVDLVASSLAFWICIAANALVGLSMALPLYLYFRERGQTDAVASAS